jgi:hypothetical protein
MNKVLYTALLSAALSAPAVHAEDCTATTTNPGYVSCAGSFTGNLNGSASEMLALATDFGGSWTYAGKSDDAGSGPFTSNPASPGGTLTFDDTLYGEFVIGLKAADQYSYYLFDAGATGYGAITFDTLGVAVNKNDVAQALSHAALYTGVSAVPEPADVLLLAAGLALVGVNLRRARR